MFFNLMMKIFKKTLPCPASPRRAEPGHALPSLARPHRAGQYYLKIFPS
jgi:hypothetical protein